MDGNKVRPRPYYRHLEQIIKDSRSLLNLGSGTTFAFERLCKQWNPSLQIVSADFSHLSNCPDFIHTFYCVNVAEPLEIPDPPFDIVTLFEVIEHVDNTDILIENAKKYCRNSGIIVLSFPNLASIFSRLELLLGYQPHVLEVSNNQANFGMGIFGKLNNPSNVPLHHIRGITRAAGIELVQFHELTVNHAIGCSVSRFDRIWSLFPRLSPVTLLICINQPNV